MRCFEISVELPKKVMLLCVVLSSGAGGKKHIFWSNKNFQIPLTRAAYILKVWDLLSLQRSLSESCLLLGLVNDPSYQMLMLPSPHSVQPQREYVFQV